jgi:hypothetical protein
MRFRSLTLLAVVVAVGCSKSSDKLPELHPVKGTLTKGGQTVRKGSVRFMPEGNQDYIVSGEVDDNGKFELETISAKGSGGNRQKGAPPGTYTVTYLPASTDQQKGGAVVPLTPTKTYQVEAKANDLNVELLDKK